MKFKIERILLLNALSKVTRAVSVKNPLPALTGIKFELDDEKLILIGSNSDLTIKTIIDQDIEIFKKGKIVLNARYIFEIVRKITGEYIDIEIIDGLLTRINDATSEFNLNGSNAIDYPNIDLSKTGTSFDIKASLLKEIINQTKFAASDRESNPILTGINFVAKAGKLECISTDSYRLAKRIVNIDEAITFDINIPKNSLDEISKIIDKDQLIKVYVSNRKILFEYDNNVILSRLIDGQYPNLNRLIPDKFNYELTINPGYLLSAIDRVSLLEDEQNNLIKLDLSSDEVILSSYTQEIGSVEEKLNDSFFKGDSLSISFSSIFANDAIRVFKEDKIKIYFIGPMNPIVFKEIDNDDLIQIVLPVRTS